MYPNDDFTPFGYIDNPYHCWILNPSGVLRSSPPLGLGWHVPAYRSYGRTQNLYRAHINIAFQVDEIVLFNSEDFSKQNIVITSDIHSKNTLRFAFEAVGLGFASSVQFVLLDEDTIGCKLILEGLSKDTTHLKTYLTIDYWRNLRASRYWEGATYAKPDLEHSMVYVGANSEGHVVGLHANQPASRALQGPNPAAVRAQLMDDPSLAYETEEEEEYIRTQAISMCIEKNVAPSHRIEIDAVMVRSPNYYFLLEDAQKRVVLLDDRIDAVAKEDAEFWANAPQLSGSWPDHWRRGMIYDSESLRMTTRPPMGVFSTPWDAMNLQAPRAVLAETTLNMLMFSYAQPSVAKEAVLGLFESALAPNVPCLREDGSSSMIANDGAICGTGPDWCLPIYNIEILYRRTQDLDWLKSLYPHITHYLKWWLEERTDHEGWLIHACSWESGQDNSTRYGFTQDGGASVFHLRPVDLQATFSQAARIVAEWATTIGNQDDADFWERRSEEYKTRSQQLWHDDWFQDFDARHRDWRQHRDIMHFIPLLCDVATEEQRRLMASKLATVPDHPEEWADFMWVPVLYMLLEVMAGEGLFQLVSDIASIAIERAYHSMDSRSLDGMGGIPGITREYWGEKQARGLEGYAWSAISCMFVIRHLYGFREERSSCFTLTPAIPSKFVENGATFTVSSISYLGGSLGLAYTYESAETLRIRLELNDVEVKGVEIHSLETGKSLPADVRISNGRNCEVSLETVPYKTLKLCLRR